MSYFSVTTFKELNSSSDLLDSKEYSNNLTPSKCKLNRVVSTYVDLPGPPLNCCLKNCKEEHNSGFVLLLEKKKQIYICKNCGEKYFELKLSKEKTSQKRQLSQQHIKDRLNTILEQSTELQQRINTLKNNNHGANWLYFSIKNFRKNISKELINNLIIAAQISQKTASETETPVAEVEKENSVINELKQVDGLEIFINDIRQILIDNVLSPLLTLQNCDKDNVTSTFLNKYNKWADDIEQHLQLAKETIDKGQLFFAKDNIQLLALITKSGSEINKIIEFQNQYKRKLNK